VHTGEISDRQLGEEWRLQPVLRLSLNQPTHWTMPI